MKISLLSESNSILAKKFRLSFGVSALIGFSMAAAAFILSRVVASTGFSFGETPSDFFYSSHCGVIVLFIRVFLIIFTLLSVIFPQYLLLQELHNNNWYMYSKMGYSHSQLLFNRYLLVYPRVIRTYLIGFFITFAASVAILGFENIDYRLIGLTFVLGLLIQTVDIAFLFLISAVFRSAASVSIAVIPLNAAWYAVINKSGLFSAVSTEELSEAFGRMFSLDLGGVIILPILILIFSVAVTFMLSKKHSSEYSTEELGADELIDLEVTEDMLVLEKGTSSYKIAISGPVVNGKEDNLEIPKLV